MSIPAKDAHLAALNHHLTAVAIVFDFVNPVLALWRLLDRGSKLWLDESEAGGYAKHYAAHLKKKPGRLMPGLLPLFMEREVVARGAITTHPNYHRTWIYQAPDREVGRGDLRP
jgi:hypothetical protein